MPLKLTKLEIEEALTNLKGWSFQQATDSLFISMEFEDFAHAFGVMTSIAIEAEKRDHHPEWLNVYNRLDIWLKTHDAGDAVSVKDIELANYISRVVLRSNSIVAKR